MNQITPHLWYDTQAVEAAEFYAATFPDSKVNNVTTIRDTPSGDADIVSFELFAQPFMAISAGPLFKFTPAISFLVACETPGQVDAYWNRLSEGGEALMPLDSYSFSERYGWTQDKFGLSWQVMLTGDEAAQPITPMLLFVGDVSGRAEEAITEYARLFPESKVGDVMRHEAGDEPEVAGTIKHAAFTLNNQGFAAMDSARMHDFAFNEAISFIVNCDTQADVDHYFDSLSAVPESEQCGWLKDKFGLSWQVVPTAMGDMLANGTEEQVARLTEAFLKMKKFDISELQAAFTGSKQEVSR